MNKIMFAALIFIIFCFKINAQCISGDCENGTGSAKILNGIYTGQFKNNLPNGVGTYVGLMRRHVYLDSVLDKGNFLNGFFLNGTRTVLKVWETTGVRERDLIVRYFNDYSFRNTSVAENSFKYPVEKYETETNNGKSKKIAVYVFPDPTFGQVKWKGKLKKGLIHGEGTLYIGEDYDHELFLKFEEGTPVGNVNVKTWYTWIGDNYRSYVLQNFTVTGDSINNLVYIAAGDTIIQKDKLLFFDAITKKYKQSISGYCTKLTKDGTAYTGMLKDGLMEGYGEFTTLNGSAFKGYFFNNLRHGPGVLTNANNNKDSGLYLLGKLTKGVIYTNGNGPIDYPQSISGNCMDGFGKASYTTISSDTLKELYEGNFVNGLPNGYGELIFRNGNYSYSKKGTFSAGYLNGNGEIISNKGVIRQLKGRFENDTLAVGSIYYKDLSSFEFDATSYLHSPYRAMPAVVFGIFDEKKIGGMGVYRSGTGTEISGDFNANDNALMLGTYKNNNGIVIPNFGRNNDVYSNLRLSYAYDIDGIDSYVRGIVAQIKWDNEQRVKAEKLYAIKLERDNKFSKNYEDPANFINQQGWVSCSACSGAGVFTSSNTIGGDYIREELDSKGNWQKVKYLRTGRTYNFKQKCSACNGKGGNTVSSKKYVGPAY